METDPTIEERIDNEIIVDCYDEDERAIGWYYYLQDRMKFPFYAICINERQISPLLVGEKVLVKGLAIEEECMREMLVIIEWKERTIALPLSQLGPIDVDEETQVAINDWHYWVDHGYRF